MSKIEIEYLHEGQVASLRLNAPKGNVLDAIMMGEIASAFGKFSQLDKLKLVVLSAEGNHFSFGASVEEHTKENAPAMLKNFHSLLIQMIDTNIPVLSQVKGLCLGGALELVLATHIIFSTKDAQFGQPEVNLSVFPPPASILLPLKIGYAGAEELLITGMNLKADKAFEKGLVNSVFENYEEMESYTQTWIAKYILPKSAVALRFAMRAGRAFMKQVLTDHLKNLENLYLAELMETHDANEGINAFLEKRDPNWQNN